MDVARRATARELLADEMEKIFGAEGSHTHRTLCTLSLQRWLRCGVDGLGCEKAL